MTSSSDNKTPIPVKLAEYVPVAASEREDMKGWVRYGDDNLFPNYLIELAESCPTHGALVNSIAQIIAGKEFAGVDAGTVERLKLDKLRAPVAADLKLQGGFYIEVIWSLDGSQVASLKHLPFELCRVCRDAETDEVTGVFYSKDWTQVQKKKYKPVYIPRFKRRPKGDGEPRREVYIVQMNARGCQYYGKPDYWSAVNWIELARQIGMFHVNNIMNGLFPSMIINFFNGEPEPDAKQRITQDFERRLSGAKNSGKFWLQFNEPGTEAPKIDSFPVPEQEKIYEWQIQASNQQIMIGHRVTSPLLFGIRDSSGLGSNADEIRQAFALFESQVIRPFQAVIEEAIDDILGITTTDIVPFIPGDFLAPQTPAPAPAQLAAAEKKKCCKVRLAIPESFEPTEEMAAEAEQGLRWRDEYGRGGTEVGVARARDISNRRNLSWDTVKRMNSYFSRHEVDKQATGWNQGEEGFPTAGRIAWQLWGGDPGQAWASRIVERYREEMTAPELTNEQEQALITRLQSCGEVIDLDEWELVSEERAAGTAEEEEELAAGIIMEMMASQSSYANPEKKSDRDRGLYKLRYAYSENISEDSREFCKIEVAKSKAGTVYRFEDIQAMSDDGVNGQFAPAGSSTYDIFTWKGGVYCHHFWKRQIYFRKRKDGKFLPNDGLKNDRRVGNVPFVPQKGAEGVAPINTPTRGSLKNP